MGNPTIQYADYLNTDNGSVIERMHADLYSKKNHGGVLTCANPGCNCGLYHVPEHKGLGGITITAHYARMRGHTHNRDFGCPYPNQGDKPNTSQESRFQQFLNGRTTKYIYMDNLFNGMVPTLDKRLKSKFNTQSGHRSVKKNQYEKTINARSAKDFVRLSGYHYPTEDFYNQVKLVFTLGRTPYELPFKDFFQKDIKQAFHNAKHQLDTHTRHPIGLIVRPSTMSTTTNFQGENAWYFMKCLPQSVPLIGQQEKSINLTPVIRTRNPQVIESLKDTQPTFLITTIDNFNVRALNQTIQDIQAGVRENILPLNLTVLDTSQIAAMPSR